MVSDHLLAHEITARELVVGASRTPSGSVIHPESWHAKLAPLAGDRSLLTHFENPFRPERALPQWIDRNELDRRFYEDAALTRISLAIESELHPDLAMLLLPGVDRVSHFLWGMVEPEEKYPERLRPSPEEREHGKAALLEYYAYNDALVGRLLENYGPNDLVMVISDHGFEAGNALAVLTGTHDSEAAIDGVVFARGPGVAPGTEIVGMSIDDVTPTLLAFLSLPVAEDMDGEVAAFLDVPIVPEIATHDAGSVELVETSSSGVEEEIVKQLRTLGYLEDEPTEAR
jgi:hypothetical protein